jgi:hypothetical protein
VAGEDLCHEFLRLGADKGSVWGFKHETDVDRSFLLLLQAGLLDLHSGKVLEVLPLMTFASSTPVSSSSLSSSTSLAAAAAVLPAEASLLGTIPRTEGSITAGAAEGAAYGPIPPLPTFNGDSDWLMYCRSDSCSVCRSMVSRVCSQSCWDPNGRVLYTQGCQWVQLPQQAPAAVSAGVVLPVAKRWAVQTSVACVGFKIFRGLSGIGATAGAGFWGVGLGGVEDGEGVGSRGSSRAGEGGGGGSLNSVQQQQQLGRMEGGVVHRAVGCCPSSFMCDGETADLLVGTACGEVQWWS